MSNPTEKEKPNIENYSPNESETNSVRLEYKVVVKSNADDFEQATTPKEELRQRLRVNLDFAELKGNERLSGCSIEQFVTFIVKETADNGLDKEETSNIRIIVKEDDGVLIVEVSDNGKQQLTETRILKIIDFIRAASSKRGIHIVSRGVLGNALPTSIAMSYVMWDSFKQQRPAYTFEVLSDGKRFKIKVEPNETYGISAKIVGKENYENNGYTTVLFKLPIHNYDSRLLRKSIQTLKKINPCVVFDVIAAREEFLGSFPARENGEKFISEQSCAGAEGYSWDEFVSLSKEETTLLGFVTCFKRYTNRAKAGAVLDKLKIPRNTKLGEISKEKLSELFEEMRRNPTKHVVLPCVGKSMKHEEIDKYYSRQGKHQCGNGKVIHFLVEAVAYPNPDEGGKGEIFEGINFTANFHRPFTWCFLGKDPKSKVALDNLVYDKNLHVFLHLVCSNVTWLDSAKGRLDLTPFADTLISVVKNVVKAENTELDGFSEENLIYLAKNILQESSTNYTIRQLFYRLVATKKYPNTKSAYQKIIKSLRIGRETRIIDPERISDFTRPEHINNPRYRSLEEYEVEAVDKLIEEFDLDRWESQPINVEVWIEKEALSRTILPVCKKYRVNLIVGKGYSSYTQVYKATKNRFPKDGKKLIILYLGDHDPSGQHIKISLEKRLMKEAYTQGIFNQNLDVTILALTDKQIGWRSKDDFDLPDSQLKKKGQMKQEYEDKYGPHVWELDVLEPSQLIDLVKNAIQGLIIDKEAWTVKEREVSEHREALKHKYRPS